jgi:thioredoxin reductase
MVLLVATGATPRTVPLPDARRLLDPRLQYSISTYAHLVTGKRAAVIGDTPRALHGVAELARTAECVYIIVPDASHLATPFAQTLCHQPNVELLDGYSVTGVMGEDTITRLQLVHDGATCTLDVDYACVSLGLSPNSAIVKHLVDTDGNGFILVNEHHETTMPALFAAGDVTSSRSEQVIVSIGDGARAAARAYDHLLAQRLVFGPPWKPVEEQVSR